MSCFNDSNYQNGFLNNRYVKDEFILDFIQLIEEEIKQYGSEPISILDIGAGIGRFSIPLAKRNQNVTIDCIESSTSMAKLLREICLKSKIFNIKVFTTDFLNYHFNTKYNVIIASEILHLFPNKKYSISKISGILCCNGCVFTRMPFSEQLISGDLYTNFPEALTIDKHRHYNRKEFYTISVLNELHPELSKTIKEQTLISGTNYLTIFKNKTYSTLHMLANETFNYRLDKLIERVQDDETYSHSIKMTFTKLRKRC